MNSTLRLTVLALVASVVSSGAPAAFAQPSGSQGGTDLGAVLHLRPDQQAAFHAYQVAGPKPGEISQLRSGQDLASMSTPQRLDRIGSVLNLQVAIFQRKAQATRAFYNVLSADQQHTFDKITSPPTRGAPPRG